MNFFGKSEFSFEDPRGNDRLPEAVSEHENESGTLCCLDSPSNGRFLATSGRDDRKRHRRSTCDCCGRCGRGWQSPATRTKRAGRNRVFGLAAEDVRTDYHLYPSAVGISERDIYINLLADLVINESDPKPMELDKHESL